MGIRAVPVLLLESCFEFNDHLLTTVGMSWVSPRFVLKIAHQRLWIWASSNTWSKKKNTNMKNKRTRRKKLENYLLKKLLQYCRERAVAATFFFTRVTGETGFSKVL